MKKKRMKKKRIRRGAMHSCTLWAVGLAYAEEEVTMQKTTQLPQQEVGSSFDPWRA